MQIFVYKVINLCYKMFY